MTSTSFEDAALEGPMALTLPGVFFSAFLGRGFLGEFLDVMILRMEGWTCQLKKQLQIPFFFRHAFAVRMRGSSNFTAIHKWWPDPSATLVSLL